MLVARIHFRIPFGVAENIFACCPGGSAAYSGQMSTYDRSITTVAAQKKVAYSGGIMRQAIAVQLNRSTQALYVLLTCEIVSFDMKSSRQETCSTWKEY